VPVEQLLRLTEAAWRAPARTDYWSEREVRAMGSRAHVIVGDAPAGAIEWAVDELERLEACWSRFRADSELSNLNRRPESWTDVSREMLLALSCAADLHRGTRGRFDPTILAALEAAGYDRTFEAVAADGDDDVDDRVRAAIGSTPRFEAIEIDAEASRVRLPHGTRIDLGGVGKGLAADLVARGLVDRGARSALVGMGGDIRARGEPPTGGWPVPVLDPFDESRILFTFPLTDGALVSSTTRLRSWTRGGRRYHHLIDPVSGDAARAGITATVVAARDAWWAEGIAKAMIIAGVGDARRIARDSGVRAWIFLDDAQVISPENMA